MEIIFGATEDIDDIRLKIDFLEDEGNGIQYYSGTTDWSGRLNVGESRLISLTARVREGGLWPVHLDLLAETGQGRLVDALEIVYLEVGNGNVSVLRGPDIVAKSDEIIGALVRDFDFETLSVSRLAGVGDFEIRGSLTFEATFREDGNTQPTPVQPLRGVLVLLKEQDHMDGILHGTTYTDADGRYVFANIDHHDGAQYYLEIIARNSDTVEISNFAGLDYFVIAELPDRVDHSPFEFDYHIVASQLNDVSQAFYIYDLIANKADDWLQNEAQWQHPDQRRLSIRWPDNCVFVAPNSCFTGSIHLQLEDGRSPDVILHEHGHYVLSRFIGESKVIHACLADGYGHAMNERLTPSCAWSEGWADFYQMALQDDPDYLGWNLESAGQILHSVPSPLDNMTDCEGLVAATLWDVYDPSNSAEQFDLVVDGLDGQDQDGIWSISTLDTTLDFESFWQNWGARREQSCEMLQILEHHLMDTPPYMFDLEIQPPQGGTVNLDSSPSCPLGGHFPPGDDVSLSASPDDGYIFDHWVLSPDEPQSDPSIDLSDPELVLTMDRDWEVTADFTPWPPPPPNLPALPVCGDQDGSERPFIKRCDQLDYLPEVILFQVPGNGPVELGFDFVLREGVYNNELGFFHVDEARGAIDGVLPGEPGYLQAFYERAVMIFPSGSNAHAPDRTVQANGGDIIMFYLVQNGKLSSVIARNPDNKLHIRPHVFFSLSELNPDSWDHLEGFEHPSLGYTQFGFEDLDHGGDKDFDDVVYNVSPRMAPVSGRVDLSPLNIEATAGDEITVTAYVIDENGDPVANALVHFVVEGPNAQSGTARTDAFGRATFTYLAELEGDDAVFARYKGWESNRSFVKAAPANPTPACTCVILCFFGGDSTRIASLAETIDRISLLYRLRDEIMLPAAHGAHYIAIFENHTVEISALMLADEGLREEGLAALELFLPGVQALVDGRGGEVLVDAAHLQAAIVFLERLAQEGSDGLATAIGAELERHPLSDLSWLTYEQAAYLLLNESLSIENPGVIEATRMSAFLNLTHSATSNGKWEWTNHINTPERYWIAEEDDWLFFLPVTPGDQALFDPSRETSASNYLAIAVQKTDFQKWFWCGITLRDEYGRTTGSGCHPDWSPPPYGAGELHPWYQERIDASRMHVLQTLINTFNP